MHVGRCSASRCTSDFQCGSQREIETTKEWRLQHGEPVHNDEIMILMKIYNCITINDDNVHNLCHVGGDYFHFKMGVVVE